MKCCGMEFVSEMVIEVVKVGLKIREVFIIYCLRIGEFKLSLLGMGGGI